MRVLAEETATLNQRIDVEGGMSLKKAHAQGIDDDEHHVDVEISQPGPPAISHAWTDYKFGDFSDWCEQRQQHLCQCVLPRRQGEVREAYM